MIGAGATGLILAQLLKHNGAARVVLVANAGTKMDLAQKLGAADKYIPLDRSDPSRQWDALKEANPHGFDIVVRQCLLRNAQSLCVTMFQGRSYRCTGVDRSFHRLRLKRRDAVGIRCLRRHSKDQVVACKDFSGRNQSKSRKCDDIPADGRL